MRRAGEEVERAGLRPGTEQCGWKCKTGDPERLENYLCTSEDRAEGRGKAGDRRREGERT